MKTKMNLFYFLLLATLIIQNVCAQTKNMEKNKKLPVMETNNSKSGNLYYSHTDTKKLNLTDAEWRKILPEDVYLVSRKADTERPFTGKYWNTDVKGTYYCAACGNTLFRSGAKFSSSCGWPSFFEQKNKESVVYKNDNSIGMTRIEVLCGRCDGHLGHLFDDGPAPSGKRYCMNSIALDFVPDTKK